MENDKKDIPISRDSLILQGKLTFEDRRIINKRWARAVKLGSKRLLEIEANRERKRNKS